MVLKLKLGDTLKLKKIHPCGSYYWGVVRLGADIGIQCTVCGRRILIGRHYLERKIKDVTPVEDENIAFNKPTDTQDV